MGKRPKSKPAESIEERENQLINLAMDVAEEQMRSGEASAMVITQFLKLGSTRAQLEAKKLQADLTLSATKADVLAAEQRQEQLFSRALDAFREYSGQEPNPVEIDDE